METATRFKGGCQGEPSNLGGQWEQSNKLGLGVACKTSLCQLVPSFKTNLWDANCTCTRSVNKECSGRPGTHLCTHCHWCCFCLPFQGRQVSSNLDKGGRHLDVSRTANERPWVGGFLQIWKQCCQCRATTPVQWNLQNSGDVALLLYVWSASSWKRTTKHAWKGNVSFLSGYATTVSPGAHREQNALTTQYDMIWLQKWQPLSQTRRRDTCWVFKQSPLAKALKTPCECASPILNLICGQSKQRNALGCDSPSCRSQPWSSNLLRIPN